MYLLTMYRLLSDITALCMSSFHQTFDPNSPDPVDYKIWGEMQQRL